MYVYEENINGRKLTEIINTEHENVKYLPGHKLPINVVSAISVKTFVVFLDYFVQLINENFRLLYLI